MLAVADPGCPRPETPTPGFGAKTYYFASFFSQKLYENERNWTEVGVPSAPLDPPNLLDWIVN